jgi:hypothetical protein
MLSVVLFRIAAVAPIAIGCSLLASCSAAHSRGTTAQTDIGPPPAARVSLRADGLPASFFQLGADTKCANQIIGYRFVVWLDKENVAVGFNTSPNCRLSPDRKVSGMLRLLVFDVGGDLKASRDLPYLADGNGELVADGEGMPGPNGTLLVRIESVNLDGEGRHESKSGVHLLDASLKDVAQLDGFLEQTTFADHAIVFQDGFTLSGPRSYSVLYGPGAKEISHRRVDWPTGAMDRKFGERGFAFMLCGQELRPGQYTSSNVVHSGVKFRCNLNALSDNSDSWTVPLEDGETAALLGILADGAVVGQVHVKDSKAGRLVVWKNGGHSDVLPWLPARFEGSVDTSTPDFSRYASFAADDAKRCNPVEKVLGETCDANVAGRWFVFDRRSKMPLVNRAFPKNGRAALSPDGNHYASFEDNELHIYSLGSPK